MSRGLWVYVYVCERLRKLKRRGSGKISRDRGNIPAQTLGYLTCM